MKPGPGKPPRQPRHAFVNPYTFVPLPEIPDDSTSFRRPPAGHQLLASHRYSGHVEVELTALSPLLLRNIHPDKTGFPRRRFPETGKETVPFIPGSSLAGVVRSRHELIAGGCLRVLDTDFRPGYRDVVEQSGGDNRTLAVVDSIEEDGKPRLRGCSEVVWADAEGVAEVLGSSDALVTGAEVDLTGRPSWHSGFKRYQVSRDQVREGEGWVVLVTDGRARRQDQGGGRETDEKKARKTGKGRARKGKKRAFWCALGRLPRPGEGELSVSDTAWRDYQAAVADAEDVRLARRDGRLDADDPHLVTVRWNGKEIGRRYPALPRLYPGQVVWVTTDGENEVTRISQAVAWRHVGQYPVHSRVPRQLLPCTDPAALCPSCRVFGAAESHPGHSGGAHGAESPEARQHSYRGHVRFSDARPLGTVPSTRKVRLAPLGKPRPGAGQFYLDNSAVKTSSRDKKGKPLREWGSAADANGQPRRLRGRKQYWLTERHRDRPFFRAQGTWSGGMASDAEQVDAGARFTFRAHFDNLSMRELGGLLVALDPALLFQRARHAVGGGKPLGFGTCAAHISALEVTDAAARYAGAPAPRVTVEQAVTAFEAEVLPEVRATWSAVEAALTADRVPPGSVWYPPKKGLPDTGSVHVNDLGANFTFWKNSVGDKQPMVSLPHVTAENQRLPLPRSREPRKGDGKNGNQGKKGGRSQ